MCTVRHSALLLIFATFLFTILLFDLFLMFLSDNFIVSKIAGLPSLRLLFKGLKKNQLVVPSLPKTFGSNFFCRSSLQLNIACNVAVVAMVAR
jgi:hypothetical protein